MSNTSERGAQLMSTKRKPGDGDDGELQEQPQPSKPTKPKAKNPHPNAWFDMETKKYHNLAICQLCNKELARGQTNLSSHISKGNHVNACIAFVSTPPPAGVAEPTPERWKHAQHVADKEAYHRDGLDGTRAAAKLDDHSAKPGKTPVTQTSGPAGVKRDRATLAADQASPPAQNSSRTNRRIGMNSSTTPSPSPARQPPNTDQILGMESPQSTPSPSPTATPPSSPSRSVQTPTDDPWSHHGASWHWISRDDFDMCTVCNRNAFEEYFRDPNELGDVGLWHWNRRRSDNGRQRRKRAKLGFLADQPHVPIDIDDGVSFDAAVESASAPDAAFDAAKFDDSRTQESQAPYNCGGSDGDDGLDHGSKTVTTSALAHADFGVFNDRLQARDPNDRTLAATIMHQMNAVVLVRRVAGGDVQLLNCDLYVDQDGTLRLLSTSSDEEDWRIPLDQLTDFQWGKTTVELRTDLVQSVTLDTCFTLVGTQCAWNLFGKTEPDVARLYRGIQLLLALDNHELRLTRLHSYVASRGPPGEPRRPGAHTGVASTHAPPLNFSERFDTCDMATQSPAAETESEAACLGTGAAADHQLPPLPTRVAQGLADVELRLRSLAANGVANPALLAAVQGWVEEMKCAADHAAEGRAPGADVSENGRTTRSSRKRSLIDSGFKLGSLLASDPSSVYRVLKQGGLTTACCVPILDWFRRRSAAVMLANGQPHVMLDQPGASGKPQPVPFTLMKCSGCDERPCVLRAAFAEFAQGGGGGGAAGCAQPNEAKADPSPTVTWDAGYERVHVRSSPWGGRIQIPPPTERASAQPAAMGSVVALGPEDAAEVAAAYAWDVAAGTTVPDGLRSLMCARKGLLLKRVREACPCHDPSASAAAASVVDAKYASDLTVRATRFESKDHFTRFFRGAGSRAGECALVALDKSAVHAVRFGVAPSALNLRLDLVDTPLVCTLQPGEVVLIHRGQVVLGQTAELVEPSAAAAPDSAECAPAAAGALPALRSSAVVAVAFSLLTAVTVVHPASTGDAIVALSALEPFLDGGSKAKAASEQQQLQHPRAALARAVVRAGDPLAVCPDYEVRGRSAGGPPASSKKAAAAPVDQPEVWTQLQSGSSWMGGMYNEVEATRLVNLVTMFAGGNTEVAAQAAVHAAVRGLTGTGLTARKPGQPDDSTLDCDDATLFPELQSHENSAITRQTYRRRCPLELENQHASNNPPCRPGTGVAQYLSVQELCTLTWLLQLRARGKGAPICGPLITSQGRPCTEPGPDGGGRWHGCRCIPHGCTCMACTHRPRTTSSGCITCVLGPGLLAGMRTEETRQTVVHINLEEATITGQTILPTLGAVVAALQSPQGLVVVGRTDEPPNLRSDSWWTTKVGRDQKSVQIRIVAGAKRKLVNLPGVLNAYGGVYPAEATNAQVPTECLVTTSVCPLRWRHWQVYLPGGGSGPVTFLCANDDKEPRRYDVDGVNNEIEHAAAVHFHLERVAVGAGGGLGGTFIPDFNGLPRQVENGTVAANNCHFNISSILLWMFRGAARTVIRRWSAAVNQRIVGVASQIRGSESEFVVNECDDQECCQARPGGENRPQPHHAVISYSRMAAHLLLWCFQLGMFKTPKNSPHSRVRGREERNKGAR